VEEANGEDQTRLPLLALHVWGRHHDQGVSAQRVDAWRGATEGFLVSVALEAAAPLPCFPALPTTT